MMSRIALLCVLCSVLFVAAKKKPTKKAPDHFVSKVRGNQVELRGGMFTFGTLDTDVEGWREAVIKGKEENQRLDDMKDSVGEETFDLINQQLSGMGRKGMEKQRVENRDGSVEAVIAKTDPFAIDRTTVTVDMFRKFVKDTGYITEAEKFQWAFVLEKLLSPKMIQLVDSEEGLGRVKTAPHWCGVYGAYWRRPEGPDSTIKGRGKEPAVHISWNDATAYCEWLGMRLPTEKEWEYAARGGLEDEKFPWGDEPVDGDYSKLLNSWEGEFPKKNTKKDGYVGLAPSDAYEPNGYGIYNMVGNVWEWTSTGTKENKVLRGGSFVDTIDGSFNHALRVSTRMENTPDSGGHNTGFRCARNLDEPRKKKKSKKPKRNEL
eukprot:m.205319 g.205319  ORF g.205319 m.205319 type:complete len:376 (+) comp15784_c0_seq1:232-1359(+)